MVDSLAMKYRYCVYLSALLVLFAFVFVSSAQQPGTRIWRSSTMRLTW
jgi:hypothetical protein